jgi:hypothetical protein
MAGRTSGQRARAAHVDVPTDRCAAMNRRRCGAPETILQAGGPLASLSRAERRLITAESLNQHFFTGDASHRLLLVLSAVDGDLSYKE